jgi:hypothetical protein
MEEHTTKRIVCPSSKQWTITEYKIMLLKDRELWNGFEIT